MTKDQGEAESLVFVVDDDASVRQALTSLLQSVALRVEAFGSAVDFLKRGRVGNGVAAACLILDVRLPGVSGLDFQAELARADMHLPIIFITGYGDIPMTVRAMKAGAVEFLTKPFREQIFSMRFSSRCNVIVTVASGKVRSSRRVLVLKH
jgi:FixJ family two-component response regulator